MDTLKADPPAARSRFRIRWRRALPIIAVLVAICLAWSGYRAYRFHREHSAAEEALAAFDLPAARDHLNRCIRIRPRDPEVRILLAQVARRDGAYDEAAKQLAEYHTLAGSTPEGKLESSLLRVARGESQELARELLPLVDQQHPASELILEAFAVESVEYYRIEKSGYVIGELLKRFPKNPIGQLLRAQSALGRGRHPEAIEICRGIVADYPRFLKPRLLLAGALYKSQRYEEGIAEFKELHQLRPDDLESLLGLARCYDRLGRVDDARPLMRELGDQHADNSEALLECGRFAIKEHRLADAERLLKNAVRIAPNDHEVQYHLSVCLEQLGKSEEARQHLAEFKRIEADILRMQTLLSEIAADPQKIGSRREMGLICLRNGQVQEAMRWLHSVLEANPNDRITHAALASYFESQGDKSQALYHSLKAQ